MLERLGLYDNTFFPLGSLAGPQSGFRAELGSHKVLALNHLRVNEESLRIFDGELADIVSSQRVGGQARLEESLRAKLNAKW